MSIRYRIQKNNFRGDDIYIGRIDLKGSYDRDMLIQRMLDMGSTITKADIVAVITNFEKTVKNICLEGNKITMDNFMQFTPALSGKFTSELDGFDPVRHEVYVTAQISSTFNAEFEQASSMEKITSIDKKPLIIGVFDLASNESNTKVTKNNIITLRGEFLKFNTGVEDEYLRFVNKSNPAEMVQLTQFQKLTDKEIVFLMPDVAFTEGYFEIASKMGTQVLRVSRNNYNLTVV